MAKNSSIKVILRPVRGVQNQSFQGRSPSRFSVSPCPRGGSQVNVVYLVGHKSRMYSGSLGLVPQTNVILAYISYCVLNLSGFSTHPVDSVDPGVHRGHHRLPSGCFLRLLGQTPRTGPGEAGVPEGVRHPPDGHVRHRLPHQLRRDHGAQHSIRARRHLDHQLR